ncbi:MAG: protein kinase [Planctomycetes bacterium]|nr:protein kinase [Planctomycetota bacterium]
MASSQIKSEHALGSAPAFPFAWSSPAVPGTETVITTLRSDPVIAIPEPAQNEQTPEIMRRLFPSTTDADEAMGIRLGHFTVQRRIGVGGMGSVFLATDEQLRRNVALKVLSPSLTADPAAVLRFQNEARAAARLDHDNIARVFFYGEDTGLHYIAYEYIPGSNLRDVIRSKDRLAPAEAVNYAMQLAAALSHTAAAGVIHRDIKPSNVLITPQGRAKLVDLGLARKESADASAELTVAGTTLGTFDYISPEQAKDPRSVDVRSDIYSLGCTLYHMLTGEPPYPAGTVLQKLLDHQGKEPPDPSRKNRRVPPALSVIVRKMMASDPRRRYSSPVKLLSDLLKVARLLGTGAVPIDGQVWLTATRSEQPAWQGNVGWIATAAALLFLVIAMERFPDAFRRIDPRTASIPTDVQNRTPVVKPYPPVEVGHQPGELIRSTAKATPLESPGSTRPPGSTTATAHSGTGASPLPSRQETAPTKVFEDLPILTRIPGDSDFVTTPTPEKGKLPPTTETSPPGESPVETATKPMPTTPGPAVTVPDPRPLISILGGKSYSSLEAACSEAKDGTIIELRYNGRRGQAESPIRLTNKDNVIIRSGIGFRPMIEFAPVERPTDAESRMITVTGGSLQLVNVDIQLTVPERITADRWAVFALERPRELQLHDVTVTVINPASQQACVIEHKAAPGQGVGNMGMMKNGALIEPPRISVFDCLVRGQCDLILLRDAVSAKFQLKDAVVALQGSLLHANCQAEMKNTESVTVDLDSVTCLTSDGLVITEGGDSLNDYTPPITLTARDNIIWCDANHPLIAMMDAGDMMETQRRFTWAGERNHFDSVVLFWQLGRTGTLPMKQYDFTDWKNHWGSAVGPGTVNIPVRWRVKPVNRQWTKLDYSAVELDPSPLAPPTSRVPGATLSKLPPAPTERPAVPADDDSADNS